MTQVYVFSVIAYNLVTVETIFNYLCLNMEMLEDN